MKYVLLLLMLVGKTAWCQNLVPNPSFEDTLHCPFDYLDFSAVINWRSCRGTPDYYNPCVGDVPSNVFGFQQAANGNAYVGILTYYSSETREYFGCQLAEALLPSYRYYVSFKVSRADNSGYATNNLGILFTKANYVDTLGATYPAPVGNYSNVNYNLVVADTANWTTVSGSFISDSSYTHLLIGNFFDDANTQVQNLATTGLYAYYYIDDVCVSTDSLECDLSTSVHQPIQSNFSIYPNPSHQAVNLTLPQGTTQVEIFNAVGQSVYASAVSGLYQSVDVSLFSEGVYFVRVQSYQGVQTQKFVVQR